MFISHSKVIADETGKTADTYYYPSSSGEEIGVGMFRSMQLLLSSGTLTLTIEASNDGVNWLDVTAIYDNENGASSLTASGFMADYLNKVLPYRFIRTKVVVATTAAYKIIRCYKYAQ